MLCPSNQRADANKKQSNSIFCGGFFFPSSQRTRLTENTFHSLIFSTGIKNVFISGNFPSDTGIDSFDLMKIWKVFVGGNSHKSPPIFMQGGIWTRVKYCTCLCSRIKAKLALPGHTRWSRPVCGSLSKHFNLTSALCPSLFPFHWLGATPQSAWPGYCLNPWNLKVTSVHHKKPMSHENCRRARGP